MTDPAGDAPAPYPWRAVLLLDAAVVALLLAVARRYGWHRDELYFLEAGQHLAWGYIDQPPFTPFIARLAHELAAGQPRPAAHCSRRWRPPPPSGWARRSSARWARRPGPRRWAQPAWRAAGSCSAWATSSRRRCSTSRPGWRCCGW